MSLSIKSQFTDQFNPIGSVFFFLLPEIKIIFKREEKKETIDIEITLISSVIFTITHVPLSSEKGIDEVIVCTRQIDMNKYKPIFINFLLELLSLYLFKVVTLLLTLLPSLFCRRCMDFFVVRRTFHVMMCSLFLFYYIKFSFFLLSFCKCFTQVYLFTWYLFFFRQSSFPSFFFFLLFLEHFYMKNVISDVNCLSTECFHY